MPNDTLPISDIIVTDRQRIDLGDISGLAESLRLYGLIQPIVITQSRRLIAGGRRLAAAQHLAWREIAVVYRETLTVDELHELELEENIRRKAMSWQETCLGIAKIHQIKRNRAAEEGQAWGYRQTGELFGIALGKVEYSLRLAKALENKTSPLWDIDSANDGLKYLWKEDEDKLLAELARRKPTEPQLVPDEPVKLDVTTGEGFHTQTPDQEGRDVDFRLRQIRKEDGFKAYVLEVNTTPYLLKRVKHHYLEGQKISPELYPQSFEDHWTAKVIEVQKDIIIDLSTKLIHSDCITWLHEQPHESFDHIITDPPYGIDMSNLSQENTGMTNIKSVEEEHDVEKNEELFTQFLPKAYQVLKPTGFLVMWCDIMQWQRLYDLALSAGFRVQRWPIVWHKTHTCINQAAQYNFTKNTELAMVCRMPKARLIDPCGTSVVSASNQDDRARLAHPFVKPAAVWSLFIEYLTHENDLILDPFAGVGSSVIPLINANRQFVAVEKDEKHYNRLLENIKGHYMFLDPSTKFI